jgi:hypothetical protein
MRAVVQAELERRMAREWRGSRAVEAAAKRLGELFRSVNLQTTMWADHVLKRNIGEKPKHDESTPRTRLARVAASARRARRSPARAEKARAERKHDEPRPEIIGGAGLSAHAEAIELARQPVAGQLGVAAQHLGGYFLSLRVEAKVTNPLRDPARRTEYPRLLHRERLD